MLYVSPLSLSETLPTHSALTHIGQLLFNTLRTPKAKVQTRSSRTDPLFSGKKDWKFMGVALPALWLGTFQSLSFALVFLSFFACFACFSLPTVSMQICQKQKRRTLISRSYWAKILLAPTERVAQYINLLDSESTFPAQPRP